MPDYVTYLELHLHSQTGDVKDLRRELEQNGWYPVWGPYDFAYRWSGTKDSPDDETYWQNVRKLHDVLKKYNVWYSLCTCEAGKENFNVKW